MMSFLMNSNNFVQNNAFFFFTNAFRSSSSPRIMKESYIGTEIISSAHITTNFGKRKMEIDIPDEIYSSNIYKKALKERNKQNFETIKKNMNLRYKIISEPDSFVFSKYVYLNDDLVKNQNLMTKIINNRNPISLFIFFLSEPSRNFTQNIIEKIHWLVSLTVSTQQFGNISVKLNKKTTPWLKNVLLTNCSISESTDLHYDKMIITHSEILSDFTNIVDNFYCYSIKRPANVCKYTPISTGMPIIINTCIAKGLIFAWIPILLATVKTLQIDYNISIPNPNTIYPPINFEAFPDGLENLCIESNNYKVILPKILPPKLKTFALCSCLKGFEAMMYGDPIDFDSLPDLREFTYIGSGKERITERHLPKKIHILNLCDVYYTGTKPLNEIATHSKLWYELYKR